jgi:hypothetical protein
MYVVIHCWLPNTWQAMLTDADLPSATSSHRGFDISVLNGVRSADEGLIRIDANRWAETTGQDGCPVFWIICPK